MTLELKSDAKEFKVALEEERLFVGKFDLLPPPSSTEKVT